MKENSELKSVKSVKNLWNLSQSISIRTIPTTESKHFTYELSESEVFSQWTMGSPQTWQKLELWRRIRSTKDRNAPFAALAPDRISPFLPTPKLPFPNGRQCIPDPNRKGEPGHFEANGPELKNGQKYKITSTMLAKENNFKCLWSGEKKMERKAQFCRWGRTFWSWVVGFSETTAFQHPRGPFHLRMLGRIGWFSSVQNCKDRAQVSMCSRLKPFPLQAARGARKCVILTHPPDSGTCQTSALCSQKPGFAKTWMAKQVPQVKKQTVYPWNT